MFGMGFMEIFLIAIVAIIALGPEKLPTAMVEIAKFLKKFKSGVEDAKSTLDNELNISEMKEEAARYKAQIEDAKSTLNVKENLDLGLNEIINDKEPEQKDETKEETEKKEKISLKEPKENKDTKVSNDDDPANKFKVKLEEFDGKEETK